MNLPLQRIIGWCGCLIGLCGAFLLAIKSPTLSPYGWSFFLGSNMLWILYGLRIKAWEMVVMQVGYTASSALGFYTWMFEKT